MAEETLSDEFLYVRSIVMGGLEQLRDRIPDWELEQRATALTRALMGHFVRGTVASGEIQARNPGDVVDAPASRYYFDNETPPRRKS